MSYQRHKFTQQDVGRIPISPGAGLGLGLGSILGQRLQSPQPSIPSPRNVGFHRFDQRAWERSIHGYNRLNYFARRAATQPNLYNPFRRKPSVLEPVPGKPDYLQEKVPGFYYYYRRDTPGKPFAVVPRWDLPLRLEIPGRGEFPRWGFPWWPSKAGDWIGRSIPKPERPTWPDWPTRCGPPRVRYAHQWNPYRKRYEPVQQLVNCYGQVLTSHATFPHAYARKKTQTFYYKKSLRTRRYPNHRRYRTKYYSRYRSRRYF